MNDDRVSLCCSAPVTAEGRTTRYWVCSGCGQACDTAPAEDEKLRPVRLVLVDEAEDNW